MTATWRVTREALAAGTWGIVGLLIRPHEGRHPMTVRAAPDRVAWYRRMVEIRIFEEKVQELFMSGTIQGTTED